MYSNLENEKCFAWSNKLLNIVRDEAAKGLNI